MTETPLSGGYWRFLRAMHEYARPRTYVEIGVFAGDSITLAGDRTTVVGIDPGPRIVHPLPKHSTIYPETSDDFFAERDLSGMIGPVDIAFIDGMHLIEYVLRDFANLEPHMSPNGVILLHDCYPPHPAWTSRTSRADGWAGDVWKLLPILQEYRPDLHVNVAACRPTGMGIVTNLDPSDTTLLDHYDEIVSKYLPLAYEPWSDALDGHWPASEHLFPVFRGPLERTLVTARHRARRRLRRARAGANKLLAPMGVEVRRSLKVRRTRGTT